MGFAERVVDFPELFLALLGGHLLGVYPPYFHKLKVIMETFFHVAALFISISTGAAPAGNSPSTFLNPGLFRAGTGIGQQAAQVRGLGLDQPEPADVIVEILQKVLGPGTSGF